MARDVAKWRISGFEALRRIERENATMAEVASAAGIDASTFRRHIGEAGYLVLRWAMALDDNRRFYGVKMANRRIVTVNELVLLQRALEKRHGATCTIEHLCSVVGLPRSAAGRVREMMSMLADDEALKRGVAWVEKTESEKWSELNLQPLPGDPYSMIEVDPLRDDHRYQRRKSTSTGAARSNRPRKRLQLNTAQMINRYQDGGQGLREIAAEAGTSPATVARRLREYGVPIRSIGRH